MRIIILLLFISLISNLSGQNWSDIVNSTDNYSEAKAKAEAYFDLVGKGRGTGYKHFLRWKYKNDYRVGSDDKIKNFNVLTYKAHKDARKNSKDVTFRNTNGNWENVGPFSNSTSSSIGYGLGRVTCVAFHPTNPNLWYVGTPAGGIWKTTTNGQSWEPLTDHFPSIGISAIVVQEDFPNTIYALTGDGRSGNTPCMGILKSVDGGETWTETSLAYGFEERQFGIIMKAHPDDPNVVYFGIDEIGFFRMTDGEGLSPLIQNPDLLVHDIEFLPDDTDQMLISTNFGLLTFEHSTTIWSTISVPEFPSGYARFDLAVCPSMPNVVYAIFNGSTGINGNFHGCYVSNDSGNTFTQTSNSPNIFGWASDGNDSVDQGRRDLGFVVDPGNHLKLMAGGVNIWTSEDGGISWTRKTWWQEESSKPFLHADQQSFNWKDENTLIVTNDGGVHQTTDFGNSWTDLSSGLSIGQFYEIHVTGNQYMGGLQDNGSMEGTFSNGASEMIGGGDGFGCTWNYGNTNIRYTSTQNGIDRHDGSSTSNIKSGSFWATEIDMHTTDHDYMFVDEYNTLWRGKEGDIFSDFSWTDLNTASHFPDKSIKSFSQCTSNPEVMYVTSNDFMIKTNNLSNSNPTWTECNIPSLDELEICDVVVHPSNSQKAWFSCSGFEDGTKVFETIDGGDSWSNISSGIENTPARVLAYNNGAYPGLYLGTEIGMYYKGDNMSNWINFANHFPNVPVSDIEIDNGYVIVGTLGRGIWRSPLFEVCPSNLFLTASNDPSGNMIGEQEYFASNSILSTRKIEGLQALVKYGAGNYIDLKPGFEAKVASFLEAKIEGCPE